MKVTFLLMCSCGLVLLSAKKVWSGAVNAPLDLITFDDLSPGDRKQLEYLNGREKRSGSSDILTSIKNAIGQGIKKKIGQIAKSSAGASAHFSSSSSGSGGHDHGHGGHDYHVPETYDHKSFDFWSLKKSILNTLLQAVKAIKGGVIAIKGQLIKGSGYLISAKGKLISTKGESITNLGKNIASSAILIPHPSTTGHAGHTGHSGQGYAEYGHPYPPSGHHDYHGSPSAPEADYEAPNSYQSSQQEDHHHGHSGHSGLLVLKKIPHDGREFSASHDLPVKVPSFKPIETAGPSFATIFGKFFKASTSLDPHQPVGFGDSAPAATIETESHVYHDSEPVQPTGAGVKIPSTNYGTPFEEEPHFLNEYSAASQKRPVVVKHPNSLITNPTFPSKQQSKPLEDLKGPHPTASALKINNYLGNLKQLNVPPSTGASQQNFYTLNMDTFPPFPEELTPELLEMYNKPNEPAPVRPSVNSFLPTPLGNDNLPTASTLFRQKRPTHNLTKPTVLTQQPFDVVRSISFELGPNGPKRLTRRQT
ncbi:unnamed protein product [Brassicogethes aeneus]|uniref:Uncharacterized protein n=1 Tax=Brassicogethes aeneus TaxID=1431903 RepID=A0A9P0FG63_BRAAE|nr:unnamed protein product [Brassicogethes aeneus]